MSVCRNMENDNLKFEKRRTKVDTCPCGKSNKDGKFAPFQGHDVYGHCFSCGETFFPPENDKPTKRQTVATFKKEPPPSYIKPDIFKRSLSDYENNNFALFLIDRFGDAGLKAIGKYFIGTTKTGGTVFWQIDKAGKIRSGKIIQYDQTGHRLKDVVPTWVHTTMKLEGFNLKQCLFGEHLIKNTKPCAIVESEKTACIASIYFPEMNWLACGGKTSLTADKMQILKGRRVKLFPDADGFHIWKDRSDELAPMLDITVSELIERKATEEERTKGFDLADYLLRFNPEDFQKKQQAPEYAMDGTLIDPVKGYPVSWDVKPKTPLERMIAKNPNLQTLIDRLDCIQLN